MWPLGLLQIARVVGKWGSPSATLTSKIDVFSTYSYSLLCMRNVLDSSGIGNE